MKLATVFSNTLLYITPLVAASDLSFVQIPKFPGHYSSVSTFLLLRPTLPILFEETITQNYKFHAVIARSTKAF